MQKRNELRIASIGAGSTYTPNFAEELTTLYDKIPVTEWVMMDIDPSRLEIVANFTRDMLRKANLPVKITTTTDLREAVSNADFVFTTIRVGGAKGRYFDETIPEKHGMIGQETTAPGGLAMGLRNIPAIVEIAEHVVRYAKPGAMLINLANPSGMLTQAICTETTCRAVGLCNWPTMLQNATAEAYGVDRKNVFLQHYGLDHLGWSKPFVGGTDVSETAYEKFTEGVSRLMGIKMDGSASGSGVPKEIADFTGYPLMIMYDDLYYRTAAYQKQDSQLFINSYRGWIEAKKDIFPPDVYERMLQVKKRAEMVLIIDELAIELYRQMDYEGYQLVMSTRGGQGYGLAGLNVMRAVYCNTSEVQIVNYPNYGTYPELAFTDVVQTPCVINRSGVYPLAMNTGTPEHMKALVQAAKHYERLAVKAAMTGDYRAALGALVASPLTNSFGRSRDALDALLIAHKADLPRFASAIALLESGTRPF